LRIHEILTAGFEFKTTGGGLFSGLNGDLAGLGGAAERFHHRETNVKLPVVERLTQYASAKNNAALPSRTNWSRARTPASGSKLRNEKWEEQEYQESKTKKGDDFARGTHRSRRLDEEIVTLIRTPFLSGLTICASWLVIVEAAKWQADSRRFWSRVCRGDAGVRLYFVRRGGWVAHRVGLGGELSKSRGLGSDRGYRVVNRDW
jgi:hypothetical protein